MVLGRLLVAVCVSLTGACLQTPPEVSGDGGAIDDGGQFDAVPPSDGRADEGDGSVSPSGLVAHYPFDGVTGSFVFDVVGGRHATCSACPGVVAGQIDSSLVFSGAQWLEIPDDPAFHLEEATVTMWMQRDDVDDYQALVAKAIGGGANNSWEMYLNDAGGLVGQVYTDSQKIFYGPAIAKDQWVHIALSWSSVEAVLYIDGEPVNSEVLSQSPAFDDNPISIAVGYDNGTRVNYYSGQFDDLRIYDHVLDSTELGMLIASTTN